jgi:hypothetical protein
MISRQWTEDECDKLRQLVDDLGLVEVLFGLANMVVTDHPDFKTGLMIRNDLEKSAKLIRETWDDKPV